MVNIRSLSMLATLWLVAVPFMVLGKGQLKTLNEETWPDMLEGEWMVEFFAPWCPACKRMEPVWKEFAEWSDDLGIKVGNVDITSNAGLSGRFMITALPTIYHVKDGVFRQYHGARDKESFFNFIEEKKWSSIEPINGWKSPQSYLMSVVSWFFNLSMTLRRYHNKLVDDFGIPYWGSYIIFGLSTILVGLLLGLMIVCALDFICPSKWTGGHQQLPPDQYSKKEKENDEGYEDEDVIKDVELERGSPEGAEIRKRKETQDIDATPSS